MRKNKSLMHAETSQIIKADIQSVYEAIQYENIPKWSKKFRNLKVFEVNGNTVKANLDIRVLGIQFKSVVTGTWSDNKVTEEIVSNDGTISKEMILLSSVPEGTKVEWSGDLVRLGKWTKAIGPAMGFFFQKDVEGDFKKLAKYLEK